MCHFCLDVQYRLSNMERFPSSNALLFFVPCVFGGAEGSPREGHRAVLSGSAHPNSGESPLIPVVIEYSCLSA